MEVVVEAAVEPSFIFPIPQAESLLHSLWLVEVLGEIRQLGLGVMEELSTVQLQMEVLVLMLEVELVGVEMVEMVISFIV